MKDLNTSTKKSKKSMLDSSALVSVTSQDYEMMTESQKIRHNRDHCNKCKDGGDLLCCDNCPRSFHFKCLGLEEKDIPEGDWYCQKCM